MIVFNFPPFIGVNINAGITGINYINPAQNQINIDNIDYIFKPLTASGNKGGNSIILKLYSNISVSTTQDYDLLEDQRPDKIIKILKFSFKISRFKGRRVYQNSHKRFLNEIEAIRICNKNKSQSVIELFEDGSCVIDNNNYLFYTMEVADCDLKEFIENKHLELDYQNKIKFCIELLEGLKELDHNRFYHRDIKPDNIFFIQNKWKIGDLGLVEDRAKELEYSFNEKGKFIGPRGWISPEVMNKYLTEGKNFKGKFDCTIDDKSDIFQMGRIFWYIFKYNAPIGTVKPKDFDPKFKEVYPIIKRMLNHNKSKRFQSVEEIITLLKKIERNLLLS